jgi:dTDP-4-amino-4,6-dideoxygalactose transaminase
MAQGILERNARTTKIRRERTMRVPFVDLKAQHRAIRDDVQAAFDEVLSSMDFVLGPNVRAFEAEYAAYCQSKYAMGVANGTDALLLALKACGVGPGDEVITVSHSFIATVEAIVMLGATPVYVDIDPETYTLDPEKLPEALSPRTRAIVPVHLYGQMADMDPIMAFARQHGLAVVEDACQAHGADDQGRRAGSLGDAAAFSFYPSKNLGAYGDGGAITTNSRAVAEHVRLLRDHGSAKKYEHQEFGWNSRLDEVQAAFLRAKLGLLDFWNEQRRQHALRYDELLANLNMRTPKVREGSRHVYHLYVVEADGRDFAREMLNDLGVATGIHYPTPIHLQQAAQGVGRVAGSLRVTERTARRVLSLPMYAELEEAQLAYVASCLSSIWGEAGIGGLDD